MSFVRDEARAVLWRWREVLAGLGVLALGAYWFAWPGGLLFWLSFPMLAAGCALVALGIPRARFRGPGGGPGMVQITEGQISYFGPLTGGVVELDGLRRIDLDATGYPAHWVLHSDDQPPLHIPVTASGADALFDAFQSLPSLNASRLATARGIGSGHHRIWSRQP